MAKSVPTTAALTVEGINLGTGEGIFTAATNGPNSALGFKSIIAGNGIDITSNADSITLSSDAASSFIGLSDAPTAILPNALLYGDGKVIGFTPPPTAPGQTLIWDGTDFTFLDTLTSITAVGNNGIIVGGSPIMTSSGTMTFGLSRTGVVAGTYILPVLSIDEQGRITDASSGATFSGDLTYISGNNGITVDRKPVAESSSGAITLGLLRSGVVAGTYVSPVLSIDEQGRVTNAANGAASLAGLVNSGSGNIKAVNLYIGVSDAGYAQICSLVGQNGISVIRQAGSGSVIISGSAANVTGDDAIAVGITNDAIALSLKTTGVIAGTYSAPTIVVDGQGRISRASSQFETYAIFTGSTTDAATTELFMDGVGLRRLLLQPNSHYVFNALISAQQTGTLGNRSAWQFAGAAVMDSTPATAAIAGIAPIFQNNYPDTLPWSCTFTVNSDVGALCPMVTGAARTNISWRIRVEMVRNFQNA